MILDAGALIIPCFRQPEPLLGEKTSLHQLNAFASMWAVLTCPPEIGPETKLVLGSMTLPRLRSSHIAGI